MWGNGTAVLGMLAHCVVGSYGGCLTFTSSVCISSVMGAAERDFTCVSAFRAVDASVQHLHTLLIDYFPNNVRTLCGVCV